MNILDLFTKPLITISASEKEHTNALDLFNNPLITISASEKEHINALDFLNKPISNEFNNIDKLNSDKLNSDKLKSPIKVIGIDVPAKLNTQIKINVIKPNKQDKCVLEQQTPVKVIRIQIPKSEPKLDNCQVSKPIKINIIKTDDQKMNTHEDTKAFEEKEAKIQTKMNNLEADNKLLSKKLVEMTTAYVNVCNYNKNLSIALAMRR